MLLLEKVQTYNAVAKNECQTSRYFLVFRTEYNSFFLQIPSAMLVF